MKRDPFLYREILLALESIPHMAGHEFNRQASALMRELGEFETVTEHLRLMAEDGLVDARIERMLSGSVSVDILALRSRVHDVLEAMRQESRVKAFLAWAKKHAVGFTVDLLLAWVANQLGE